MARYFSEQTLLDMRREGMYMGYDLYDLEEFLAWVPSADVVPKSEAERLENAYNRAIRKIDNKTITAIRNAKQEVAREIFEEIESISFDFPLYGNINTVILSERDLAFIKKKYTEGENEDQRGSN